MDNENRDNPNPLFNEPIYTIADAAKMTRLKPLTLWDKLANGDLLRTKVGGRTFIRLSELRKLIKETRREPNDDEPGHQSRPRGKKARRTSAVAR